MSDCVVGIDLGGTNARCALIDRQYNVLARERDTTPAEDGFTVVMESLAQLVAKVLATAKKKASEISGLCISSPGTLDCDKGIVVDASNLQWLNVPAAATLEKLTGIKTMLENDANAAGYGEFIVGAGRGTQSMLMMTLGTGVGGAVIIDGVLRRGPCHTGGELGHIVIQDGGRLCVCGQRGCIEAYSSATATVARFIEGRRMGWLTKLAEVPDEQITCADIFNIAKTGDVLAEHIVAGTARYIAIMAASMANLLNPDRLVIGGGMIRAGDFLFDQIRAEYHSRPLEKAVRHMDIVPALLGEDAGVVGAAGLAFAMR